MRAKFSRTIQPRKCPGCGKLTTAPQSDAGLCNSCYDGAGYENEHYDNGHPEKLAQCPICSPENFPNWR